MFWGVNRVKGLVQNSKAVHANKNLETWNWKWVSEMESIPQLVKALGISKGEVKNKNGCGQYLCT